MKSQRNLVFWIMGGLLAGILVAFIAQKFMYVKDNQWIVVLIIAGAVLGLVGYYASSNLIKEVGIKDYKLVFSDAVSAPVAGDFGTIAPSQDDMIQVGEQGIGLLEEMLAHYSLSEQKPILMIIRLGENYPREVTLDFIKKLSNYNSFKFVIFVDRRDRFVAYTPAWAMRQRLSKPGPGDEFLTVIGNPRRRNELFDYSTIYRETIRPDSKRIDALQALDRLNLSAIPVVDSNGELKGVAELDKVISHIILKLAENSTSRESKQTK